GALLLVAMGYSQLSMNQASLARISYLLKRVERVELLALLEQALQLSNGQQVRARVQQFLAERDLTVILG
ncbi:MAG: hypothetical protein ACRC7Q_12585, partial [Plesiomonas shigelloides]